MVEGQLILLEATAVLGNFTNVSKLRYYSYYLHLNSIAALSEGDVVSKGTEIGTMGQTGDTSFTHLHFETRLVGYCSYQFLASAVQHMSIDLDCPWGN